MGMMVPVGNRAVGFGLASGDAVGEDWSSVAVVVVVRGAVSSTKKSSIVVRKAL